MNREILFRGKRIDNGEWVYGQYTYLLNARTEDGEPIKHMIVDGTPFGQIVDPSTVGQYTGLTDKNGKRIFEGDILQIAKKSDSLGTYFFPPVQYPINVVVKWDLCAWMWEVQGKEGPYYIHFPDAWCHYECKVIGNIHDNPELLEGD